jgi:hypothetical protein
MTGRTVIASMGYSTGCILHRNADVNSFSGDHKIVQSVNVYYKDNYAPTDSNYGSETNLYREFKPKGLGK